MSRLSLLERLRTPRAGEPSGREIQDSIVANLRRILNTREGSTEVDPGLGMPDLVPLSGGDWGSQEVVDEIVERIRRLIEVAEPRIRDPEVTFEGLDDRMLVLRFLIRGTVGEPGAPPLRVLTSVSASGRTTVA